ncbi:AraC family transcriptional regulator [Paraburkholderia eburnea]|uniref:AraC family transcriptional regulator n=1 Tax=Paraburkholderia eburnea TaxID=1189126 RepID=A0A2S4MBT6_9BURK|nr:AraC family transcriptional regulator [Paraburkholderia eburnea]POR52220.1 AraC family transcriptional regulator [Paraburkholderia eburnea]PRZ23111.1 AraC family transcriptional regulator [Paraburkholderia eburnea]
MKAAFELVDFGHDCSIRVYHRQLRRIPFEWHHHPEYELTLTLNSQGKRYIGDSVTSYGADDLVLVPPNLPHTWASNRSIDDAQPQVAIVVWFDGAWVRRLADVCPEYNGLCDLLRRAACGLAFEEGAGARMRDHLDRLLSAKPRERLHAALDVLELLSTLPATPLASPGAFDARTGAANGHESDQINRVLALIETQFSRPLRLSTLAKASGLSERSLTRHFTHHLGESVGRYINRVRIGHACRMLTDTQAPVSVIAMRSGFPNAANFNRQFKAVKSMTPVEYRLQFTNTSQDDESMSPRLTERSASLQRRESNRIDRKQRKARK